MSSIVIGGNSALWMEHQFAACGNSCRVFGELVFDEETSKLFLESDADALHFLCGPQLSKKDNVVDV